MNTLSLATDRRITIGICFALVLLVWFVFGQTLSFDFVNYDDPQYVTENLLVQGGITWEGVVRAITHSDYSFYHPLTTLSHMLDYEIYGLNPAGFHFTNVVLHTLSALILFLVLRSMTGSLWKSCIVAAIFAIHPLRAESVAWVTERKDCLSGLFFMLTLASYVRYVRRPFSVFRYGLVFLCMIASMLSKATVVTLPFILLLLDCWPLGRIRELCFGGDGETCERACFFRLIIEKIPLLLLSAGICCVTVMTSAESLSSIDRCPVFLRLPNALVSYFIYILQTVFPVNLTVLYPFSSVPIPFWKSSGILLLMGLMTLGKMRGFRKCPYLLVGWFWYLGMLLPMIGIVQAGAQAHADRYTYLSQIGLVVMIVWGLGDLFSAQRVRRGLVPALALIVLLALAMTARIQTACWQDGMTLMFHTLSCTENNYISHVLLGGEFINQGEVDQAILQYKRALQINPSFQQAHYNLGNAYVMARERKKAIEHYEKSLQLKPTFKAHYNMGLQLALQDRFDEAIDHLLQAVRIYPDLSQGYVQLGSLCLLEGELEQAILYYEKAIQLQPDHWDAHRRLAWLFAASDDEAIWDGARALELARRANELSGGNNWAVLDVLAAAYAETSEYVKAIVIAERAIRLIDDETDAHQLKSLNKRLKLYQEKAPFRSRVGLNRKVVSP